VLTDAEWYHALMDLDYLNGQAVRALEAEHGPCPEAALRLAVEDRRRLEESREPPRLVGALLLLGFAAVVVWALIGWWLVGCASPPNPDLVIEPSMPRMADGSQTPRAVRQHQAAAAKEQFLEALRLSRESDHNMAAIAANNIGSLHLGAGELDSARHYYHIALEHEPGFPDAEVNMASCLLLQARRERMSGTERNGRRMLAVQFVRSVLVAYPNRASYWATAGAVYAESGMTKEAGDAYRRSLQLDPGNEAVRQNLRRLTGEG